MTDYSVLPENLPEPQDDGAADHLPGRVMPSLTLMTSDGAAVDLAELGAVVRCSTCIPSRDALGPIFRRAGLQSRGPEGARPKRATSETTSPNSNGRVLPASTVLSSQTPDYQAEVVERLHLPFAMLSDTAFDLADALGLPTFSAPATNVSTHD